MPESVGLVLLRGHQFIVANVDDLLPLVSGKPIDVEILDVSAANMLRADRR